MKNGFTLLETLISVTIVASIGILITQVFFSTTRVNTKTELLKDVKQNGDYAMDIMSRLIRGASAIQTVCDPTGTTTTSLNLVNPNGDITTLQCAFDNNVTRVASTSGSSGQSEYLTSQNVTLGGTSCADSAMSLSFFCTSYPDQPSKVTINLKLSQKGTPADQFEKASIQFQTTVAPRY